MYQKRLETLSPPAIVEVGVQLILRDRANLLAPEARGDIHPLVSHAAAANAVLGPQPSPHNTDRRPPAACPTLLAAPVAVENTSVSEFFNILFDGPEESLSSSPLPPRRTLP